MNYIKKKNTLPENLFKKIKFFTNDLIAKYPGKSIHLTDEEFQNKNFDLYCEIKNNYKLKKNIYITIRVACSDNSINEQFHYDGHLDSTVIPIIFSNFKEKEQNGDLYISKKLRNIDDNWIVNLIKKILKQNRIYRYFVKKIFLEKKFDKVGLEVGDEVSFNGYRVFHGNNKIEGNNKIRASLIIHSDPVFQNNLIFDLIKYLRHKRYKLQ